MISMKFAFDSVFVKLFVKQIRRRRYIETQSVIWKGETLEKKKGNQKIKLDHAKDRLALIESR